MARLKRTQFDRPDARCAHEFLSAHDGTQLFTQFGEIGQILCWRTIYVSAKPFEPFGDVGGVSHLAQFAIAHYSHTRLDLLLHRMIYGGLHDLLEMFGVDI